MVGAKYGEARHGSVLRRFWIEIGLQMQASRGRQVSGLADMFYTSPTSVIGAV